MSDPQPQILNDYYRQCPGEHYKISDAVCNQRRKHHYPKCPGCRWNPATPPADAKAPESPLYEVSMIDKVYKAYDIRGILPGSAQ